MCVRQAGVMGTVRGEEREVEGQTDSGGGEGRGRGKGVEGRVQSKG